MGGRSVHLLCCLKWFVITVAGVVGWQASSCGAPCLPRWEGFSIVGAVWEWCGRVKETVDQLTSIYFVRSFVNPTVEGAVLINLDGGNVLEEKAKIFYHEVFSPSFVSAPHDACDCSM